MADKKAQSKAGIGEKRRGQQMGDERSPRSSSQKAKESTPALRGRRVEANKYFADESRQAVGSDGEAPSDNSPSTPAAIPTGIPLGQSGGEKVFKQRQAKLKGKKAGG